MLYDSLLYIVYGKPQKEYNLTSMVKPKNIRVLVNYNKYYSINIFFCPPIYKIYKKASHDQV